MRSEASEGDVSRVFVAMLSASEGELSWSVLAARQQILQLVWHSALPACVREGAFKQVGFVVLIELDNVSCLANSWLTRGVSGQ